MYLPDLSTFDTNAPRRPRRPAKEGASTRKAGDTDRGGEPFGRGGSIDAPLEGSFGVLQDMLDATFRLRERADRLDLIMQAELRDPGAEAMEVVLLLPPGVYLREQMADQLNSIVTAHGWGQLLGTVE